MNEVPIKVLMVEDDPDYAQIIAHMLRATRTTAFDLTWEKTISSALDRLAAEDFDVALLDLMLPDSKGLDTLRTVRMRSPDTPVVLLTAMDDETLALEALREGAQDYLVKTSLPPDLLTRALRYAIERNKLRRALSKARRHTKVLEGLLPICSVCKQIRDANDDWKPVEVYIVNHSEADFTHSICPQCRDRLFAELDGDGPSTAAL